MARALEAVVFSFFFVSAQVFSLTNQDFVQFFL